MTEHVELYRFLVCGYYTHTHIYIDDLMFYISMGLPSVTGGKELPPSAGDVKDMGSILGLEHPLEDGIATHFSILACRIPWTKKSGRLQSIEFQSQIQLSMHTCVCVCVSVCIIYVCIYTHIY